MDLYNSQNSLRRTGPIPNVAKLLADCPSFNSAGQPPAIINGGLALTSKRLPGGGATVEVARRQPDGTWPWVIDNPALPA